MGTERLAAKPRCFVAMRFGDDEVAAVYDQLLKPIIEAVAVPRVVNRIVHNDRIDRRIIKELDQADLAVADLTHARPSVYYEAGYADRRVPVVYTCREDHLRTAAPDSARVHFDLAMVNCVPWRSPTDSAFRTRFRAQFRLVIAPILDRYARQLREDKEEQEFSSQSVEQRLNLVVAAAMKVAQRAGWPAKRYDPNASPIRHKRLLLFIDAAGAVVADKQSEYRVNIFARRAVSIGMLREIGSWLMTSIKNRALSDHVVLLSLSSVQTRTVEQLFHSLARDRESPERSWTATDWPLKIQGLPSRTVRLTVIDNIKSARELTARLLSMFPPDSAPISTA